SSNLGIMVTRSFFPKQRHFPAGLCGVDGHDREPGISHQGKTEEKAMNKSTAIKWVIVVVCAALLALIWFKSEPDPPVGRTEVEKAINAPIRQYTDQQGRNHGEKPAADLDKKTAPVVLKSLYD